MALSKVDLANQVENQLPQNLVANNLPFRNIIINGDMSIAQRGTSATGLGEGDSGYHTCDRWRFAELGTPTYEFTQTQSTDVPSGQGFAKSLKMDVTTAQGSLASSDLLRIQHLIEGQNLQYLKKGTANAESLTLSFWVKSNKTGTYIAELVDVDNTRTISKSYTIDSASIWEKKTITYDGDTTGAFDNDNSASLYLQFYLLAGTDYTSGTLQTSWGANVNANKAVGQVNLADSTSNEWLITGVQLEAGTTASDFEFLPYDVNLNRCQRYYWKVEGISGTGFPAIGSGHIYQSTSPRVYVKYPFSMRSSPTLGYSGTLRLNSGGSTEDITSFGIAYIGLNSAMVAFNTTVTFTVGNGCIVHCLNTPTSYFYGEAEL